MTPRNALSILQQAASKFLGTLEDHTNLQAAVKVLEKLVAEDEHMTAKAEGPVEPPE